MDKQPDKKIPIILPLSILLVGIGMMVLGAMRGETDEILRKATVICLECIGIG